MAALTDRRASLPSRRSLLTGWAVDVAVLCCALALFYGALALARYWAAPVYERASIQLAPSALPKYALFSLARIAVAYGISLAVALVYAYIAAHDASAERALIPLLDTLQSIPVLSFLPGVMVAMVALFPSRQLGIELGAILLIFTGQVWNMAFSAYSSFKNVPEDLQEAARVFHFNAWERFTRLELPYAAIGLVWNSMMSVAGGWFFLMACEMFVLGNRDLRLQGLGSYLQTAANAGDMRAILWGVGAMIVVIILVDQLIWRPVIAWSQKFKFEQVEASLAPRSPVLDVLRRSRLLAGAARLATSAVSRALDRGIGKPPTSRAHVDVPGRKRWFAVSLRWAALAGIGYGIIRTVGVLLTLQIPEVLSILVGVTVTFGRVELALLLAALWTVPVGIYVGMRPQWAAVAQPVAQIAASVPATALFPIVLLALIRAGGGLGIGSIVLLLLGTQWYLLFNVIAGASAIPTDLREVCEVFHVSRLERWRRLLLPAIFPHLLTGFVTASGGAWNAGIVAEYFRFRGQTFTTTGVGSIISRATDAGRLPTLLAATLALAAVVVTINRFWWRRLYALATTRFRLE